MKTRRARTAGFKIHSLQPGKSSKTTQRRRYAYESQPCIAIAKTRVVRRRQQAEETNLFT
jgi:hypothetical protein